MSHNRLSLCTCFYPKRTSAYRSKCTYTFAADVRLGVRGALEFWGGKTEDKMSTSPAHKPHPKHVHSIGVCGDTSYPRVCRRGNTGGICVSSCSPHDVPLEQAKGPTPLPLLPREIRPLAALVPYPCVSLPYVGRVGQHERGRMEEGGVAKSLCAFCTNEQGAVGHFES